MTTSIEWDENYSLGHLMLDKEHKTLFEIANEALVVVDPSLRKEKIKTTLKKLFEYMSIHFDHEEHFMDAVDYPEYIEHKRIHQEILQVLQGFVHKAPEISHVEFEKELAYLIEKYLIQHILHVDSKIHLWIKESTCKHPMVTWKDSFLIGNELIDSEHKHLFDIAQKAFEHNDESMSRKERVKLILSELYDYTKTHFAHEEVLMQAIEFYDLDSHILLHRQIEQEMHTFIKSLSVIGLESFEEKLALFIEKWLIYHVINDDRRIAEWMSDREELTNLESE